LKRWQMVAFILDSSPFYGSIGINKCVPHSWCITKTQRTVPLAEIWMKSLIFRLFVLLDWVSKLRWKKGYEGSTNVIIQM